VLKSGAHLSYGVETAALPIGMVVIVLRAVTPSAVSAVMAASLRTEGALPLPVGEMHVVMRTQRLRQNLEAVFLRIVEALVQGLLSVGELLETCRHRAEGVGAPVQTLDPGRTEAARWREQLCDRRGLCLCRGSRPRKQANSSPVLGLVRVRP
jgi:hypothetical protein